jgi:hypothetical protein
MCIQYFSFNKCPTTVQMPNLAPIETKGITACMAFLQLATTCLVVDYPYRHQKAGHNQCEFLVDL